MELIIEEKKAQPISYEGILKNMNLKVVDGKLSQDEPIKKNVYFYPQENNKNIHSNYSTTKNNIAPQAQPPRQLFTHKQKYIKYLFNKINQKKRISQIKSKKMYFV